MNRRSPLGSPLRSSLRGLRLRTEMTLRGIPVFRSAYFPIPHRPTFGAPVFRSAYSASRNARASAASRPPSSHTVAFSPKRSTFRFAPLTLRCRTEMTLRDIPVFRSAYSASRNARAPAALRPSVGGGSFAPPCTPLSRRPPDTGRIASKAPLEGSWRAAPEGWVRHGDARFRGIEERRFRLRLTGLHAFCRRQRLWNQSVWPSRMCRAKALMSEKAGQSRPAPPASPSSCTSEPAVMSK